MMLLLAVTAMMATPALAAEYEFADSDGPMYAPSTSVDQVIVVGGGVTESSNIDRSKNTAVLAPPFGSPESYLPGAGTAVIPQSNTSTSSTISGDTIYVPPAAYDDSTPSQDTSLSSNKFTLPDGLFYEDGNVLTSGAASTYMFTSFELSDDNGILLGLNRHNNSLCIVDPFNTKVNKNANFTICGTSGAGKTFTTQVMALRLRMRGVQCYILAPLKGHEFKRACHKIGGTYIKLAPGSSACINVMEIRPTLTPEMELIDELDYTDIDSMLAKKIQQLMIFFSLLIPDMNNEEEQMLDEALVKTYAKFGITHDNSSIYEDPGSGKVKTMPILGDLYEVLKENPLTTRLATIVSRFVTGSAQSFNRQTNVNLDNKYVVLDISELKGKMLPVGMMIALDYVWDQVKADRTKRKMIFIDEIWKLIGGAANKQAAEFCLEIFKIIRGYGGGALAATQDLSDFFGLEDGRYGRAILNNSKTKIILNLEPDEAEYVKDVLKLTRTEIRSITQFERGEALISSNSNKVPVIIKASREEQQMITTDRAELEAMLKELKAVADTADAASVPDSEAVEASRDQLAETQTP